VVLNGRAGETETVPRIQLPDHLASLGFRILDGLGLIQNQQMILLLQQLLLVPAE